MTETIQDFLSSSIKTINLVFENLSLLYLNEGVYLENRIFTFKEELENAWKVVNQRVEKQKNKINPEILEQNGLTSHELILKLKLFDFRKDKLYENLNKLKGRIGKGYNESDKTIKQYWNEYRNSLYKLLNIMSTIAGSIPILEFLSEFTTIFSIIIQR